MNVYLKFSFQKNHTCIQIRFPMSFLTKHTIFGSGRSEEQGLTNWNGRIQIANFSFNFLNYQISQSEKLSAWKRWWSMLEPTPLLPLLSMQWLRGLLSDSFLPTALASLLQWGKMLYEVINNGILLSKLFFWNSRLKAENFQNFWDH